MERRGTQYASGKGVSFNVCFQIASLPLVIRGNEMKRERNWLQWHAKSRKDLCRKQAYIKMMHSVPIMSELPAYAGLTASQAGKEDRG